MARRQWCFNDADRALLLEAAAERPEQPELRALVLRARHTAELPGLWTLPASERELLDLWELVDELMNGQKDPQRYAQLDGMLETLDLTSDGI